MLIFLELDELSLGLLAGGSQESRRRFGYEKRAHIVDPHIGLIAIGARSATVIGPDGAICDALATALMVDGVDAQKWIGRPELSDYSFWIINRHDGTAWSYGPNKGC